MLGSVGRQKSVLNLTAACLTLSRKYRKTGQSLHSDALAFAFTVMKQWDPALFILIFLSYVAKYIYIFLSYVKKYTILCVPLSLHRYIALFKSYAMYKTLGGLKNQQQGGIIFILDHILRVFYASCTITFTND